MPTYLYKTADGETVEHVVDWVNRPDTITLNDGRTARFDFGATISGVRTQRPALDGQGVDRFSIAVHPNQVEDYNRTAASIGLDTRWNERGHCITPNRTERKKLARAMEIAKVRGSDPEFKPDTTKGPKP